MTLATEAGWGWFGLFEETHVPVMAAKRHTPAGSSLPMVIVMVLLAVRWTAAGRRPHLVVIMADDLGFSDVGFRNPERYTPNLDRMAEEGVKLNYSYMQQVCTPSRAAFMTGVYPFRMGLQNSVLSALDNDSLPLTYTLLPQRLQTLGYATHYVGKWHLGFCHPDMTPTRRGFHTFYGMYLGKGGYYNHTSKWDGYDLHDNVGPDPAHFRVAWEAQGTYSTQLFTQRAVDIIQNHDPSQAPLFLFLSYQAVHGPLEVPDTYLQLCQHLANDTKRKHCAMTAAMDEGIGLINKTLVDRGFSDNLITLFTSDNGGPVKLGSSNWPLRGAKITLWEGGTRVVSILHSKKHLPNAPYEWNGLIHAVDWYPTLVRAAQDRGGVAGIDGVDSWMKIVRNRPNSKRLSFLYNIDDVKNTSALRYKKFKLINNKPGSPDGWYNPPGDGTDTPSPSKTYPEYMLFNVVDDPEETKDLSQLKGKQSLLANMTAMLEAFKVDLRPSVQAMSVDGGKPKFHNGSWVSGWCSINT